MYFGAKRPKGVAGEPSPAHSGSVYLRKKAGPKVSLFVEMGGVEPPSKQSPR